MISNLNTNQIEMLYLILLRKSTVKLDMTLRWRQNMVWPKAIAIVDRCGSPLLRNLKE